MLPCCLEEFMWQKRRCKIQDECQFVLLEPPNTEKEYNQNSRYTMA
jgi:hypothetical protein